MAVPDRFSGAIILVFLCSSGTCLSTSIQNTVLTWSNLHELQSGGWEGTENANGYDKPSDILTKLSDLDTSSDAGVWAEIGGESSPTFFSHKFPILGREYCNVKTVRVSLLYHSEFATGFVAPCRDNDNAYCYLRTSVSGMWNADTFEINVDKLDEVRIEGFVASPEGYFVLDSITMYHDGETGDICNTTTSTITPPTTTPTTTTPTTTPTTTTPTTTSPITTTPTTTSPITTTPITTTPTTTTPTTTTPTTTLPSEIVVVIDLETDIPGNGHWTVNCNLGYAHALLDYSGHCPAGDVDIPPPGEELEGLSGFWTKCDSECIISYEVQPNDISFTARVYQTIPSMVSYDGSTWDIVGGSGWVEISKSLVGTQIRTIMLMLDNNPHQYLYSLLDSITLLKSTTGSQY